MNPAHEAIRPRPDNPGDEEPGQDESGRTAAPQSPVGLKSQSEPSPAEGGEGGEASSRRDNDQRRGKSNE